MFLRNKVLMTSLAILLCLQWSRGDDKIEDQEHVKDQTSDESSKIRNLTYSSFSKIKIAHPPKDVNKIKKFLFKKPRFLRPYQDWSLRINTETTPTSSFATTSAYNDQTLSLTAQNELPESISTPPTVGIPSESQQDRTTFFEPKEKNKAGVRVEHFYSNNPFIRTTTVHPEAKDSRKSSDSEYHISSPVVSNDNVPKALTNTEENDHNEFKIYSDDYQRKTTSSKQHTNSPERYFPLYEDTEPASPSSHRLNKPSEENLTRDFHPIQKNGHSDFIIFSDDNQHKNVSSKQRTNSPRRYFPIYPDNRSTTRSFHRFNEPSLENHTRNFHQIQRNVETLESTESNEFKEPIEYFIPLNIKLNPRTTVVTNYQGNKSQINIKNSKSSTLEPKRTRPNSQNSQIYLEQSHTELNQHNKNLKVTPTITQESLNEHTNFGIKLPDNSAKFILNTGIDGSPILLNKNIENAPVGTNFRNDNKSRFVTTANPEKIYDHRRPPPTQPNIFSYFRREKEAIPHVQVSPFFPARALLTPVGESSVESQHDKIISSEQYKGNEAVQVDNIQNSNHFTENFKPQFETAFPITPRKPLHFRPVTTEPNEQFSKTINKPVNYEYSRFKIHSGDNQYQNPSNNQKILPAEQSDPAKSPLIDTEYSPGSFLRLETSEKNLKNYRNQPQKQTGTLKNVQSKDFSVPREYFIPLEFKSLNAFTRQPFSTETDPSIIKSKDSTHETLNARETPQQQQPYFDHPSDPSKKQYETITFQLKSSTQTPKEQNVYDFRNFESNVNRPLIKHNINEQNFPSVTNSHNEHNIARPKAIIKEMTTHVQQTQRQPLLQQHPFAYSRNVYKSTPRVRATPLLHGYVIQKNEYSPSAHTPPVAKSVDISRESGKSHSGHGRNTEDDVRIDRFRYPNSFVDTGEAESQAKIPLTSGQQQFDIPLAETPIIHDPKKSKKPRKFEYSEFTSYSSDRRHPTPSNKQQIFPSEQVPPRSGPHIYQKPSLDYSTGYNKPSEGHSLSDSYEQQKDIGSFERVKENGYSIPSEYLLPLDIPLIPSSFSHSNIPKKETQSSKKNSEIIQTIKAKTSSQRHQPYLQHTPNHSNKQHKRITDQYTNTPPSQIQYNSFDFRIPETSKKFYANTDIDRPLITHNPVLESSTVSQRKFNSPFVNEARPEKIQNPERNYRPKATRPPLTVPDTSSVLKNEYGAAPQVESSSTFSQYDDPAQRVAELRKEFEQIEQTAPAGYQDPFRIQHHHSHTLPTVGYTGYKSLADSDTRLKNYPEKESSHDLPVQTSYLQNYPVDLKYHPTSPPETRDLNYENPSTSIFHLQPKNSHSATSRSSHNFRFPETQAVFRTQLQPNYYDNRHKEVSSPQMKPKPTTPSAKTNSDKGCKTIVKEIHDVPKGSKPEKLDSQPTSIIKTRICFFPEDSPDEPSQLADVQREFYEPVKFSFDDFREEKLTERNPKDEAIRYQPTNDRDTYKTHSRSVPRSVEKDKDNKHDHHLQRFGSSEEGTSSYVDEFPYFPTHFKEDISARSHERIPVQQPGEQTAASNSHEERPLSYHSRTLGNRDSRPYFGSRYVTDDDIAVKSPYSTRDRKKTVREPYNGYRSGYSNRSDESRHRRRPKNYNKTFSFYKKNNEDNNPNSYSEEYVRGRFRTYSSDNDNKKERS